MNADKKQNLIGPHLRFICGANCLSGALGSFARKMSSPDSSRGVFALMSHTRMLWSKRRKNNAAPPLRQAAVFVTVCVRKSIITVGVKVFWGTSLAFLMGAWAQRPKLIEVASIKPSSNTMADSNLDSVRGRLTATNITVRELVRLAYGVRDYQIGQAPKWIDTERFDIAVKSARDDVGSMEAEKSLVRELLADRFQLTTHRESKQMAIYLLVVAKNGPRLKAHNDAGTKTRGGCGRLVGRRVTADAVAAILSRQVEREVFNRTGLSGEYDFELDFTPDSGSCRAASDGQSPSAIADAASLPSLYTALQQQLGLKLESSKGAAEMLVIDRVEEPSDN